jgi:hypothetical protein
MYIWVNLYWEKLIILWLSLEYILNCRCRNFYCGCFNFFVCVGVCMCGFLWCVVVCMCGFWNVGWFGNTCTCIYCVLNCFVYIYVFLLVLSVLPPRDNSIAASNNNNNNNNNNNSIQYKNMLCLNLKFRSVKNWLT